MKIYFVLKNILSFHFSDSNDYDNNFSLVANLGGGYLSCHIFVSLLNDNNNCEAPNNCVLFPVDGVQNLCVSKTHLRIDFTHKTDYNVLACVPLLNTKKS